MYTYLGLSIQIEQNIVGTCYVGQEVQPTQEKEGHPAGAQ
jgi:hypothetical protein